MLLGNGDGTFGDAIDQLSGDGPHSVVAADFDGDGNVDLAVRVNYSAGNGPHGIRAGDLDGDGNIDLVTANDIGDSVSFLIGDGSGDFGAAMEYAVGVEPKSVAIADIDRDGHLDVVASNTGGNYPTCCVASGGDNVGILYGNGDGSIADREDVYVGLTPFAVKLADLNSDGLLDLATANWDAAQAGVVLSSPAGSSSITLNWDAATDYGVGVAGYRIYRNSGTSPYAETTETSFTDSGLSGNTDFSYEVTAIDRASPPNESLPAGPVTITTLP